MIVLAPKNLRLAGAAPWQNHHEHWPSTHTYRSNFRSLMEPGTARAGQDHFYVFEALAMNRTAHPTDDQSCAVRTRSPRATRQYRYSSGSHFPGPLTPNLLWPDCLPHRVQMGNRQDHLCSHQNDECQPPVPPRRWRSPDPGYRGSASPADSSESSGPAPSDNRALCQGAAPGSRKFFGASTIIEAI